VRRQAAVTTSTLAHEPAELALRREERAPEQFAQSFNYAQCPACGKGIILAPPRKVGERFVCEACGEPLVVTGPYNVLRTRVSTGGTIIIAIVLLAAIATAWIVLSAPKGGVVDETGPADLAPPLAPGEPSHPAGGATLSAEYVYIVPDDDSYHTRRDCEKIPPTATLEAMSLREARRQGRLPCATCGG
jgi:ribosomal protein S27AE